MKEIKGMNYASSSVVYNIITVTSPVTVSQSIHSPCCALPNELLRTISLSTTWLPACSPTFLPPSLLPSTPPFALLLLLPSPASSLLKPPLPLPLIFVPRSASPRVTGRSHVSAAGPHPIRSAILPPNLSRPPSHVLSVLPILSLSLSSSTV